MILILTLIVSLVWIWSEFKGFLCRNTKSSDDFNLTNEETRELREFQRKERAIKGSLARAKNKVASLEQLGIGVRKTRTGNFDRRSKLGKKLNKELPRARALALRYQNQQSEIQSEMELFQALPEARASIWVAMEARRLSNRMVFPVFAAVLTLDAIFGYRIADYWFVLGVSWLGILLVLRKIQQKSLMRKLGY